MPSLSYQERSLYGALLVDLAVFCPYFIYIHTRHPTLNFIAGAVTILILAQVLLQSIIALISRNRLKDERDRLILLRGYRAGYVTVLAVMLFIMAAIWLHTTLGQINPNHMALPLLSLFFATLMLGELVKTVTQLVAYRRTV